MANKLIIHEKALKEWNIATAWYEKNRSGLGSKFNDNIDSLLIIIEKTPELYAIKRGEFRITKVPNFPYIIVYTFYKNEKIITINSIFHTSQHPKKKFRK